MPKTIYKYSNHLEEGEPMISQGDIFSNLPIFSYDYLLRSEPIMKNKFKNEKFSIFEDVIQKGCKIQTEGFISPTWGILASQDCDIKPKKDLIFLPLVKTKSLEFRIDIIESVNNEIRDSTRRLYISKLIINDDYQEGPFEIIFQNPFFVPYEIIMRNYKKCWRARLIEPARKILLGKLSHFYTRTPIEEFLFLENKEITKYFIKDWERFWKKEGRKSEKFQEKIEKVKEVIDLLLYVKRKEDIKKIFYYDIEFIDRLMKILEFLKLEKNAEKLLRLCTNVKKFYNINQEKANSIFETIIHKFCIHEDSLLKKYRELINIDEIREIRNGAYIEGILPSYMNQNDAVEYAKGVINVKNHMNNIPDFIRDYLKIGEYIKKV